MKLPPGKTYAEINLLELEKEAAIQAELYRDVAERHAIAKGELADAEQELELVKAELKYSIRRNPKRYGISRLSNPAVEEVLVLQEEYQFAKRAVIDAQKDVDRLRAAMNTLDHKKQSVSDLTYLHGQGYFAAPKIHPALNGGVGEYKKRSVRKAIRREDD